MTTRGMKKSEFHKLKAGDKVRIIDNTCSHSYKIGDVVTVTRPGGDVIQAKNPDGTCGNNLNAADVEGMPRTIESYQSEVDALHAKAAGIASRIACMQLLGVDTLSEDEYRVYRALETIDSDITQAEKVKAIASLLN